MKTKLLLPLSLFLALTGAVVLIGCKQAEGERCQVTADCEDGLTCNQGTNPPSCQAGAGGQIDAPLPDIMIDMPTDEPVDSDVDAMIDAS